MDMRLTVPNIRLIHPFLRSNYKGGTGDDYYDVSTSHAIQTSFNAAALGQYNLS